MPTYYKVKIITAKDLMQRAWGRCYLSIREDLTTHDHFIALVEQRANSKFSTDNLYNVPMIIQDDGSIIIEEKYLYTIYEMKG